MPHFNEAFKLKILEEMKTFEYKEVPELDKPPTIEEIRELREKLRTGKAAGLDKIKPEMLKYGKKT